MHEVTVSKGRINGRLYYSATCSNCGASFTFEPERILKDQELLEITEAEARCPLCDTIDTVDLSEFKDGVR